jgi:glycerol-3-phosphate dehydrogenase (NAD(P)+)
MAPVGIVGATTWGTTLAILAARNGLEVMLWARDETEAALLREQGENRRFLPGTPFPSGVTATASPHEAFSRAAMVIFAVPSRTLRENARAVRGHVAGDAVVVSATKGLELSSGKRMSQVLAEELPPGLTNSLCALSGPNLAAEIVQGKPSSTVVASRSDEAAGAAQEMLTSPTFRVYRNRDIVGVELGGALKNIVALGAGICDGFGFGDNAKAVFMTRGLAEIARLGVAAGGEPMTLAGLAGMGDLIATCSSRLSRNHQVGELLARGESIDEIRASMAHVAEGVDTTAAAMRLASRLGVEMPITQATHSVLFDGMSIEQAVSQLMGRTPASE